MASRRRIRERSRLCLLCGSCVLISLRDPVLSVCNPIDSGRLQECSEFLIQSHRFRAQGDCIWLIWDTPNISKKDPNLLPLGRAFELSASQRWPERPPRYPSQSTLPLQGHASVALQPASVVYCFKASKKPQKTL